MTKTNKRLLVGTVFVIVVGWIWITAHFANKREEMQKHHTQQTASLRYEWSRQRRAEREEYRAELENAWGGRIEAAIKDPDLPIADMLRKATVAACPECTRAEVKTDNFNEFDVFIYVKSPLEKETAAAAVKTLLRYCSIYVNSVSFVYNDEVVKTTDRRGIDAIKDWASVDLTTVAGAMYTP